MEYGATVWDPYQKYNSDKIERVQRRAARFVKSRYSRYSSVSDMLDVLGGRLFLKGDRRLASFCFTKLLTVWHKCPSKASLSRFFPKTISAWNGLAFAEAPSLAVFRSNFIRN